VLETRARRLRSRTGKPAKTPSTLHGRRRRSHRVVRPSRSSSSSADGAPEPPRWQDSRHEPSKGSAFDQKGEPQMDRQQSRSREASYVVELRWPWASRSIRRAFSASNAQDATASWSRLGVVRRSRTASGASMASSCRRKPRPPRAVPAFDGVRLQPNGRPNRRDGLLRQASSGPRRRRRRQRQPSRGEVRVEAPPACRRRLLWS
jgi:hypothetical protein